MEYRKNLELLRKITAEEKKANAEEGVVDKMPENAKTMINELLFQIMPSKTTLEDLEDFACAIYLTVESAYKE